MQNTRNIKMLPKRFFMRYCLEKGWKFHLSSLHETHVNSNKLNEFEKFCPSFIVDRDFSNPSVSLVWVEIKSCNRDNEIKVPKVEFDVHEEFNQGRSVFYALFNPASKEIKIVSFESVVSSVSLHNDFYIIEFDDIASEVD